MVKSPEQDGNVLFLILIAVALFAALSYAVTSSTRSGGEVGSEQAEIQASALIQLMNRYTTTVNRLVIGGCDPTEITFEGSPAPHFYTNSNAPADNSCHVFHPDGGGLSYMKPDEDILDQSFSGVTDFGDLIFERNNNIDTTNGPNNYSLVIEVPFVNDSICLAINQKLNGIDSIPTNTSDNITPASFIGNFAAGGYVPCETSDLGNFDCSSQMVGCFKANTVWGSSGPANIAFDIILKNAP